MSISSARTLFRATVLVTMTLLTVSRIAGQPPRPHIVFIMVDDLGWNDVGYQGASEIFTPNLDELACDGVRLKNYYTGPTCGPSRTQFLSGRYSIHLGLTDSNLPSCTLQALNTSYNTVADELKTLGYSTHAIGKWHAGFYSNDHMPTNRGFDTFRGFLLSHSTNHYTRDARHVESGGRYGDYRDNEAVYKEDDGEYSTTIFTDRAKEIIGSHNASVPMFMYLAYQAVHSPWEAPAEFQTDYSYIPHENRKMYASMVAAMDDGVGQVVKSLKDAGMYEDTVIIFATDNGGGLIASNHPLKGAKGGYFEGGIRGVGLVSSPLIPAAQRGRDVTSLMHVTDWLPTMVGIAGESTNLEIDGFNQWDLISGGTGPEREEILHHIQRPANAANSGTFNINIKAAMVNKDGWKIMTGTNNGAVNYPNPSDDYYAWALATDESIDKPSLSGGALFNIYNDPEELVNEYDNPLHESVRDELLGKLRDYQGTMTPVIPDTTYPECNPSNLTDQWWGPWIHLLS